MRLASLLLLLAPLSTWAQPPAGYYDAAAGLSGEQLRAALYGIIDGHTELANSQLWAAFASTDRKADDTVWDMYSDIPGGTPAYSYAFGSGQCGTYSGEGDCFNREHSFPQSWFNGEPPMDTDLFHMYPTDAWANQKRANNAYGTVSSTTWVGSNGSKLGQCNYPGCSGVVFEPIDAYKGDFARSYFYMLTRYLPQLNSWTSPMMQNGEFSPWAETMLLEWHLDDPVSEKETNRNNAVFNLQGNRNPYIDQPQWVQAIWGPTADVAALEAPLASLWFENGLLRIEGLPLSGGTTVEVRDAAGRTVMVLVPSGSSLTVPMTMAPGLYVASVRNGDRRSVLRFIP
jgi:endonuclease I